MIPLLLTTETDVMARVLQRAGERDTTTEATVRAIIDDVAQRGDAALLDSARRFDAPGLDSLVVTAEEIETASVPDDVHAAIQEAARRVHRFHELQRDQLPTAWGVSPDLTATRPTGEPRIGQRYLPVRRAGVYVPGGGAAYPSSVLMNAIPGRVAGAKEIAVTTPARTDGTLHPAVLVALREAGVDRAIKIGGAAAIAALALGTESVPRVDVIVGPGNRFVNEAKRQLWGRVGLDGYAGPSEVLVLADDSADARFAAADLLTQIEHAPDNAGFLVGVSRAKVEEILAEVERQLTGAPRDATMRQALAERSLAVVARDLDEAIEVANAVAPEHMTLAVCDPEAVLNCIENAGCVLLGEHTPESAGDYLLGPSHTLPTSGAARWQGPVNVLNFLRVQSVARLEPADLSPLADAIATLAEAEGFPAHAYGATVRQSEYQLSSK